MRATTVLLGALLSLSGCDLFGVGGGGGVADGGLDFTFTKGFTFTRKDDRSVYLADESDLQTVGTLTSGAVVRTPSFNANASRIVFVQGTGAEAELRTVASTGGASSIVLTSSTSARNFSNPVFSPDGTRIAFGFDEGSTSGIGIINADGTGLQKLNTGGLSQRAPSFTPDGASIVVAAGTFGSDFTQIEVIALNTNTTSNLTNTLGSEAQGIGSRLVVSPDGTKAVFDARVSTGVTRIFVIDLSTKAVTRLTSGDVNANDTFPCWMNGSTIAFSSDSGGNDNVYQVGLSGGSPMLLLPKAVEPWYGD